MNVLSRSTRAAMSCVIVLSSMVFAPAVAQAATVKYMAPKHVFSINDVQGDGSGTYYGTACLDLQKGQKDAKDGLTYYAIDSIYGYDGSDFGGEAVARPLDGKYQEGWVANIFDEAGNVIGVKPKTPETPKWKTGALKGEWLGGLGSNMVKASTEHYVVMDHVLNAPWMPTLVEGVDYTIKVKDDGLLYKWGNYAKKPTDIRLYAKIPLPAEWKQPNANYKVTSARLVITHNITGSPNDQIRPEDFGNHGATGILPRYTVASDGRWLSAVDAFEGDGHFIPAGTILRDAAGEYTNAWYTSLDRDPFAGPNPRWRLKAGAYGQDLPGVEIPQYTVGELSFTDIDLLAPMLDEITGEPVPSPLLESKNWMAYLDEDGDGLSDENFVKLTNDFDLSLYIKGDYKGTPLYDASLIIEYDNVGIPADPVSWNDVTVTAVNVPSQIKMGASSNISVRIKNNLSGAATGTLTLVGRNKAGAVVDEYTTAFTTPSNSTEQTYTWNWTAPARTGDITWTATVSAGNDKDLSNNSRTAVTKVVR